MIQLSENKIFIGLDNRTNVLSCNLESSRPKSAEEKLRAKKNKSKKRIRRKRSNGT